jgi:hypothetical protein
MRYIKLVLASSLLVSMTLAVCMPIALAAPPAQEGQDYVVVADDWLSKLADKYLGNPFAYPAIVEYTNQKHAEDASYAEITDPDLIEVGWKVYIPSAEEAATIVAEVAPAAVPENVFVYAHGPTFPDIDPSISFSNDSVVVGNAYETLVFYNPPGSAKVLSPPSAGDQLGVIGGRPDLDLQSAEGGQVPRRHRFQRRSGKVFCRTDH